MSRKRNYDPAVKLTWDAAYRERNRSRLTAKRRNAHLKNRYGITEEEFNLRLKLQGNRCAICKKEFTGIGKKGPHVDHSHKTVRVRELLCHKCNIVIAYAYESTEILQSAMAYLTRHDYGG